MNKLNRYAIVAFLLLIISLKVHAQNLSLSDLQTICNKSNWEYVNQYLINKGWEYYESEKGSSTKYNTITWSLNKSYDDKAEGWFYLYTYEGFPNKIIYTVYNKLSYTIIQKYLSSKGYKLTGSDIEDDKIISKYSNSKFLLEISTAKQKKESDFYYDDKSITAYSFLLIKKTGIYDSDNGNKTEYWWNNNVKTKYTLKNGKLNGKFISYYSNGNTKKKGYYSNGKENGKFIEYYENGFAENIYSMKNDKLNGAFKSFYDNGELKKTGAFINGKKNGPFVEYNEEGKVLDYRTYKLDALYGAFKLYDEKLILRKTGKFKNGNEDGYIKIYNDKGILTSEYYLKNDKLNGSFKSYYESSSQIKEIGKYSNGKRNGVFIEFLETGDTLSYFTYQLDSLNGIFKTYFENGQLRKIGSFIDGQQNGKYKEYAETGELETTYTMKEGEYDGLVTIYNKNRKYKEAEFKNGILSGSYKEYLYNEEGELFLIKTGEYLNENQNGKWDLYLIEEENKERLINSYNYKNGIKEGSFQKAQGDSLIFGNYQNDKLNGDYKIYVDFTRMLIGGIIRTDTANMILLCEGRYYNDLKTGIWKYFDLTGSLKKTGRYSSDKKTGKWSYYYTKYVDSNSNSLPYSGELFLTETYENGIKNGLSKRFSSIKEVKCLCDTSIYKNVNPLDTCTKQVYKKEFQSFYYKNGELHGPCVIKDSIGTVIFKGNFLYGKKDGEWLESYKSEDIDNNSFYIFEKGEYNQGKRVGIWKKYANENFIWQTSHYSNGKLNGDMVNHLKNGGIREIKRFKDNFLKELIVYDSTGYKVRSKYEILNETNYSLKVRKSEYNEGRLTASLEYYMEKDDPVLNYNLFELIFLIKTAKLSDGESGYPDGELIVYKSGYPDGELIVYDEKGEVKIKGKLKKEDKIGIWKYNYPDQSVQIQIEYKNNEPSIEKYYILNTGAIYSGIFKFTDDENKVNEKRKIKDGLRNGATVYYDFNGKKIKKEKYKNGLKK